MGAWGDAASWSGEGLRREVFFFGARDARLYGSLYSAETPTRPDGVVVCSSWGFEAACTSHLAHCLALSLARLGGAGMVFDYPGFGDSQGPSLAEATIDSMAAAAAAAIEEAARRRPQLRWFPAGLMLGAALACLAQGKTASSANRLLLIQPALRPSAYFARLRPGAHSVTLRSGRVEEVSFAYPFPRAIADAGDDADRAVREALAAFGGEGTVIRHARPPRDELLPRRFEDVVVEGTWRVATKHNPKLEAGMREWLRG